MTTAQINNSSINIGLATPTRASLISAAIAKQRAIIVHNIMKNTNMIAVGAGSAILNGKIAMRPGMDVYKLFAVICGLRREYNETTKDMSFVDYVATRTNTQSCGFVVLGMFTTMTTRYEAVSAMVRGGMAVHDAVKAAKAD
jgi:hypothetical protein